MAELLRVLLVTRNLPPLLGGMERLNWHMADELARAAEVDVVAPADSSLPASERIQLHGVCGKPLWRFLLAAAWRGVRVARLRRPDIVLAGSGLTAPIAWLTARASGARAAVYLHGLDIGIQHPLYAWGWLPFIRRMDLVIANSNPTRALAIARGVAPSRIEILHPGVELPGPPTGDEGSLFRQRHCLGPGPILLSVGRLTERKGLREFVRDVLPLIAATHPDVQLVVVGDVANDALAARSQSRESILAEARANGLESQVHFVGAITDPALLSQAYRAAAVHVFPVREIPGDPEGFGMVAIEAAAHGLATVGYATGGVVDAVNDGTSGFLIPTGIAQAFAATTRKLLLENLFPSSINGHASRFAWPVFGEKFRRLLGITPRLEP